MMDTNVLAGQKTRKKYTPQFKEQALEHAEKVGIPKAATDLGIADTILYSWRTQRKQSGLPFEHQKLQQAELSRLKREVSRLAEENAFLKKAALSSTGRNPSSYCATSQDTGETLCVNNRADVSVCVVVLIKTPCLYNGVEIWNHDTSFLCIMLNNIIGRSL